MQTAVSSQLHRISLKAGIRFAINEKILFYIRVIKDTSRQAWRQGMSNPTLVMYEEEFQEVNDVIERLLKEANAKVIFLVDKNGQLISGVGETERFDTTSLASLTAGNIAATGGLAKLIGEKEFSILFHEGEKDNLHISIVGGRVILVVLFDNRSSLGLVRLRVKKSSEELSGIFERLMRKSEEREKRGSSDFPFAEITDEDIDNLFG
jgi:predicted regulator of Ras-like GTPase activity (Roadblock/LC7/MglB family)